MYTLVVIRNAHSRSVFAVRDDSTGLIVFKSFKRSAAYEEQRRLSMAKAA